MLTQSIMPRHVRNNDSSKYAHAGPLQATLPSSRSRSRSRSRSLKSVPTRRTPSPPERDAGDRDRSPVKLGPVSHPAVGGGRGASGTSRSVAGRAAPKLPAVSKRVSSNAALPSRRSDVDRGLIPMVTPTPAPTAEVASQRHAVVHGSIEWTQGLTPEQMLKRNWFVRSTSHDKTHWSRLVWRVTEDCPLAKLEADSVANHGSDRKEMASMDAPGATTHVCMWPDPITKKPCGHSWHFKPKATRNSQACDVFSPSCKSIQSSYVTHHIYSKHGVPTDAKVLSVRRQETHFAHAVLMASFPPFFPILLEKRGKRETPFPIRPNRERGKSPFPDSAGNGKRGPGGGGPGIWGSGGVLRI